MTGQEGNKWVTFRRLCYEFSYTSAERTSSEIYWMYLGNVAQAGEGITAINVHGT